jgi:transposase InsO family protein
MQKPSMAGSRYILVFTNDYSRKSWIFFMKSKADTFDRFKMFKERIELETWNKISCLRTDRGGKYMSNEFKNYCIDHGIKKELKQACTP